MGILSAEGIKYLIKELKSFFNTTHKVFMYERGSNVSQEVRNRCQTRWPQDHRLGDLMTIYTFVNGACLTQDYICVGKGTINKGETNEGTINNWLEANWLPLRTNLGSW